MPRATSLETAPRDVEAFAHSHEEILVLDLHPHHGGAARANPHANAERAADVRDVQRLAFAVWRQERQKRRLARVDEPEQRFRATDSRASDVAPVH